MSTAAPSGYIYELLHLLGVSQQTALHVQDLLLRPLSVIGIIIATIVVARVGSRVIRKALGRHRARSATVGDLAQASRVDTVGRIVADAWRVAVTVIGTITILSVIGIDLAPFLAGATVIGATIGFGAQSLVRDFLSGLLMLLEDQYRIGDLVEVNDVSGTVEEVSLRITRLRSADGTVWFIPNGQILKLGNSSRHWSRALITSEVALGIPIAEAYRAIEEAARDAVGRPEIVGKVIGEAHVLGVSQVTPSAVSIDLEIRTAPAAAQEVARAIREAVTIALGQAKMLPPPP